MFKIIYNQFFVRIDENNQFNDIVCILFCEISAPIKSHIINKNYITDFEEITDNNL